jgi:hypothetical protein
MFSEELDSVLFRTFLCCYPHGTSAGIYYGRITLSNHVELINSAAHLAHWMSTQGFLKDEI